ncbi:MAG: hypothetical protein H6536_01870 [Bacteroidales bacterium]|nr:hypothetical protein [Bacteroidales bacterium]
MAGSDTSKIHRNSLSNKTPEYYLVNLPTTDSLKTISNQKIMDAMVKVAEVYQNDLNDTKEAKAAYLALAQKYPKNPIAANAYYHLYKISNGKTAAPKRKSIKAFC